MRLPALVSLVLLALICLMLLATAALQPARADPSDGYESPLAQSVRQATERYRLSVWAVHDGYVQTTDYLPQFGVMYTNHQRFDPPSLAQPTVLVFDLAGRLVACGYQYEHSGDIPAILHDVDPDAWYAIPEHVHYNVVVQGKLYYAQQPWSGPQEPTAAELIRRKLMPPDASLQFAFVHPAVRALLIWAWLPNPNGLFDTANPALP